MCLCAKGERHCSRSVACVSRQLASAVQVRDVSGVFPEPFGLDRHRLRLKSGASEKLKLSFLPFVMPAAAALATSPSKGRKSSKVSGADNNLQEPPRARSLLVLKDSDCGEFTYELIGEVGQPATFLQHETKVGLDGQQVGIDASMM